MLDPKLGTVQPQLASALCIEHRNGALSFNGLLPSLEVLEIRNIDVWCRYFDEVYLESEKADGTMVDLAFFNLGRIGRGLKELVVGERRFKVVLCCQFVINSLSDETIVSSGVSFCVFAG